MDAKRELTSVDLAALVAELGRYEGAKVDKVYLYDDDLLRFRMRDFDRGRVELLIEVGEVKRAHVADPERVADAPERPPNFAMMLRNRLSGADFAGVSQYEFDRILRFEFERDDEDTTVVAELLRRRSRRKRRGRSESGDRPPEITHRCPGIAVRLSRLPRSPLEYRL